MTMTKIAPMTTIIVTLISASAFAKAPRRSGCMYVPSASMLILQSVYSMGIEGSKMYQATGNVRASDVVGSHQFSIQAGGFYPANSTCQVDIQPVGGSGSNGKSQYQISYSKCDVADFLIEEQQQFVCEF